MLHTQQEPIFMSVTYNAGSDTFLHPNQNYLVIYKQSPHSKFITSGMVEIGIFLNHTNTSNDELSNIPICWISNLTVTHVRLMNSIRLYQLFILTSITEIIPKLCYTKNIIIKKKLTLVKTSISKLMPMFLIKHSYK